MTSNDILIYCEKNNIDVTFRPMEKNGSVSFKYFDRCYIGIDDSEMTESERKTHLVHEIGHCETDSFYSPYTPLETRSRCEHKANRWAIKKILPKSRIEKAMQNGAVEVWQLAEHFEIGEELIRFALKYYFDKGM